MAAHHFQLLAKHIDRRKSNGRPRRSQRNRWRLVLSSALRGSVLSRVLVESAFSKMSADRRKNSRARVARGLIARQVILHLKKLSFLSENSSRENSVRSSMFIAHRVESIARTPLG